MSHSWGNFSREYGTTPNYQWTEALMKLSIEQVERGYIAAMEARTAFAPSLSVFLGYCLDPVSKSWSGVNHSSKYLPLNVVKSSAETKELAIANLKNIIKGKTASAGAE